MGPIVVGARELSPIQGRLDGVIREDLVAVPVFPLVFGEPIVEEPHRLNPPTIVFQKDIGLILQRRECPVPGASEVVTNQKRHIIP